MKTIHAFLIVVACLHVSACSSPRGIRREATSPPLRLDDRVLIASPDAVMVASDFVDPAKGAGRGMAEGAAGGAAAGLEAALKSGLILFPPAAAIVVGGGAAFGAAVGGVGGGIVGSLKGADAADLQCISDKLAHNAEAARLNSQLAYALQKLLLELAQRDIPVRRERSEPVGALYPKLISLQLDGQTFGGAERTTITMRSTLLRQSGDDSLVRFGTLDQYLRPRPLRQWCTLSDEALRLELQQGVNMLATRMSDMLLLAPDLDVVSNSECPSYRGLALVSPPPVFGLFGQLDFSPVDSLNPVLSWEAFPRTIDLKNNPELSHMVEDVVYDLAVSRLDGDTGGHGYMYARQDLKDTSHRIEDTLEAGHRYVWRVRPRFRLLGVERSLSWSRLTYDTEACVLAAPSEYSYRFQTSGQ